MKDVPYQQQLYSSKDGFQWIPHLDGKQRTDIGDWTHQNLTWDEFQTIYSAKTESQLAQIEYNWAKSEINSITEQLEKHADNSSRAIATEQEWRDYREALRDYATVDSDGVYSLRTEKPVRPS